VVIESLAQAVRGAAFAVPGALGAQEGGLIALCAIFGIPAEAALALSLVKRLADLLVGVPGLFAWHALEGSDAAEPAAAPEVRTEPALRHDLLVPVLANDFGGRVRAETDLGDLKKCA
jgi:hypothetical protein